MNTRGSQSAEGAPGATEAAKLPNAKACREMVADCSAIVFCCASTKASRRETSSDSSPVSPAFGLPASPKGDHGLSPALSSISPRPLKSHSIFKHGYASMIASIFCRLIDFPIFCTKAALAPIDIQNSRSLIFKWLMNARTRFFNSSIFNSFNTQMLNIY